ncbi:hypothetical protein [Salinibacter ruber]|uniref:hypothetical protein n=1 Tax=Salinibacter ruber TaxID=146919 RepID=UPI002074408E|nr:hypothetical protein [Salinibacter ruber]
MTKIESPIVLFVYRRPNYTAEVLKIIKNVSLNDLYIVADGPKNNQEKDLTEKVRKKISTANIDAKVHTNYSDQNLGLRDRFASGLEWVFNNEDKAIILEDDIRPSLSFFKFCDELLSYYEGDQRVWDITGTNHIGKWNVDDFSYHFSYHGSMWGWATWKDSWQQYDKKMSKWDNPTSKKVLRDILCNYGQYKYAHSVYEKTFNNTIDTWDYQWGFSRQINNSLSVVPSGNLVTNTGVGELATNTSSQNSLMPQSTCQLRFPLQHPFFIAPDREYDCRVHNLRSENSLAKWIKYLLRKIWP